MVEIFDSLGRFLTDSLRTKEGDDKKAHQALATSDPGHDIERFRGRRLKTLASVLRNPRHMSARRQTHRDEIGGLQIVLDDLGFNARFVAGTSALCRPHLATSPSIRHAASRRSRSV
jgi:hypothetical protein